eukprot:3306892-Rhodomonas_salina.3
MKRERGRERPRARTRTRERKTQGESERARGSEEVSERESEKGRARASKREGAGMRRTLKASGLTPRAEAMAVESWSAARSSRSNAAPTSSLNPSASFSSAEGHGPSASAREGEKEASQGSSKRGRACGGLLTRRGEGRRDGNIGKKRARVKGSGACSDIAEEKERREGQRSEERKYLHPLHGQLRSSHIGKAPRLAATLRGPPAPTLVCVPRLNFNEREREKGSMASKWSCQR